jgi:hypothetical protein
MTDTSTLEQLNTEIVQLIDELGSMQQKQQRLRELLQRRGELEHQLLGDSAETARKAPGRKRASDQQPAGVAAG